ncbi:MAG: hypothetical protein KOO63_01865 [Bacteroidales bacterium]|nr:hypothetical protein [Candidatus Latescibacterota bacterium]
MRVELEVDWKGSPVQRKRTAKITRRDPPYSRAERKLWYIAMSQHIDELIDTGQADSLAEVARMCCVSRARISQLFD